MMTIHLDMTAREADSVAWVLMSALARMGMLYRERQDVTDAANDLFEQLGYRVRTDSHGNRLERK